MFALRQHFKKLSVNYLDLKLIHRLAAWLGFLLTNKLISNAQNSLFVVQNISQDLPLLNSSLSVAPVSPFFLFDLVQNEYSFISLPVVCNRYRLSWQQRK